MRPNYFEIKYKDWFREQEENIARMVSPQLLYTNFIQFKILPKEVLVLTTTFVAAKQRILNLIFCKF